MPTFTGTSLTKGQQDTLISGVSYMAPTRLDLRLALLQGGTIDLPQGPWGLAINRIFFGDNLNTPATGIGDMIANTASLLQDIINAFRVCETGQAELHRLISVAGIQSLVTACGLNLTAAEVQRVFNLIMAAQGHDAPPGITRSNLQRQSWWELLYHSLHPALPVNLNEDVEQIESTVRVATLFGFATRLPLVASKFSSSSATAGAQDRRAATLRRMATILSALLVQPLCASTSVLHTLFQSLPFEEQRNTLLPTAADQERLAKRVSSLTRFSIFNWDAWTASTLETKGTHFGRSVNCFLFPFGLYSNLNLATGGANVPAWAATTPIETGMHLDGVQDVDPNTRINPLLLSDATLGQGPWSIIATNVAQALYQAILGRVAAFEANVLMTLSLSAEGAADPVGLDTLRETLRDMPWPQPGYVPTASEDATPIIVSGSLADEPVANVTDLFKAMFIPAHFESPQMPFDARDLARVLSTRSLSLRKRIATATGARGIPRVIFSYKTSELNRVWPWVDCGDLWQLTMPAYAGKNDPLVMHEQASFSGLSDLLGESDARLREILDARFSPYSAPEVIASTVAALSSLGALFQVHPNDLNQHVRAVTDPAGFMPAANALNDYCRWALIMFYWGRLDTAWWGDLFTNSTPIQLTTPAANPALQGQVVAWYLLPFTAVPTPGSPFEFNNVGLGVGPGAGQQLGIGELTPSLIAGLPLISNSGFAKRKDHDPRVTRYFSFPAAVNPGHPAVLVFYSGMAGPYVRLIPERIDPADCLLHATGDLLTTSSTIDLAVRPGVKQVTPPAGSHLHWHNIHYGLVPPHGL